MGSINLYLAASREWEVFLVHFGISWGALVFKSSAMSHVPAEVRNLERGQPDTSGTPVIPGDFEVRN